MLVKIYLADAFFSEPDQAGTTVTVVFLDQLGDGRFLKNLAEKFASPITAYLLNHGDDFLARWFTPAGESSMGGQGALAAADVIYQCGLRPPRMPIIFHTRTGLMKVGREAEEAELLRLSLPTEALAPAPEALAAGLKEVLDPDLRLIDDIKIWRDDLLVLLLEEDRDLAALKPDLAKLGRLPIKGLAASALKKDGQADYALRCFTPRLGVDEEHVSCDVNGALGLYWAEKSGRKKLSALQLSRRGGRLSVEVKEGAEVDIIGRGRILVKADPFSSQGPANDDLFHIGR